MDWLYHFRTKKPTISLEEEILAKQESDYMFRVRSLENALSKTVCTPDVYELACRPFAILFVYNDLMKKRRDHEALEPLKFCGDAYTTFEVNGWYRKKDKLPIVMKPQILSRVPAWGRQYNAHAAILKGEVFIVSVQKIYDLDLYHDNGVQFTRQRIDIEIPYTEDVESVYTENVVNADRVIRTNSYIHKTKAWAYLANVDYWWNERINSIDFTPMPIFTPKKTWKNLYYYHARQYPD